MSRPTTSTPSRLFGEIRSLEHTDTAHVGATLDALGLAIGALDSNVDPDVRAQLERRFDALSTMRLEHVLESRSWSALGEHVYSYTNHVGHQLVGIYSPDTHTFGAVCPPLPGDSTPRFVELLGTAKGFAQIEGMLACIEAEFTPREVVVELDEATVLGELERRRAYLSSLDHDLVDLAESMSDAWGHDDYMVYDPALSTGGYFDDDCSSIWVARNARFDSADEARDWARERAGRAPAYYRLSLEWRFLCSGKTYNKYSDPY